MVLLVRSSLGLKLKHISSSSSDASSEIAISMPPTDPFVSASIPLTVKADLATQKDSTVFEHKVLTRIYCHIEKIS